MARLKRRDLKAVAKAYNRGKSEGGKASAHRQVRAVLKERFPAVAHVIAMLAAYLGL